MSATHKEANILEAYMAAITRHPRYFIGFIGLAIGIIVSVFGLVFSFLICAVCRYCQVSVKWPLLLGSLLLLLSVWVDHMSLTTMMYYNERFLSSLFEGDFLTLNVSIDFLILSAIPYAVLMSSIWLCLLQWQERLGAEVSRVSKGRVAIKKPLSFKRLDRAIKSLDPSVEDTGALLGVDRYTADPVILTDTDANLHTLAVGTTGSGKTTALMNIVERAIQRRWPLFYIDGKGDAVLAKKIQTFAKSQGVPCYIFSMLGESVHYNPLAFGGYTSKKDRIVALRRWSEEHYKKIAEGYLQMVFKLLDQTDISLDLSTLSRYLKPHALYGLAREYQRSDWIPLIEVLETQLPDIQSLLSEIENMVQSEIGHLFKTEEQGSITLEQVLEEKGVIYFCLQPLCFPTYAETLGKLIINDLKSLMAAQLQREKKTDTMMLFDEFSVFAGEQVVHLINQGRSAGVHAVLATQSLADIQIKGGDALLGQILNNTNNYIIQRQNNPSDAEILANIIGTKDNFEVTSQLSVDQGGTGIGSVRQTKAFLVHPDEIKRLKLGEAIFVNKWQFTWAQMYVRQGALLHKML